MRKMTMTFKIGDKVICIDPPNSSLGYNKEYTISHVEVKFVRLVETGNEDFFASRFELKEKNMRYFVIRRKDDYVYLDTYTTVSKVNADAEAQRLAKNNPGYSYYVCKLNNGFIADIHIKRLDQ